MSQTESHYSLASEALKSFLRGFPLSLLTSVMLWLVLLAFSTNLLHHRFFLLLNIDALQSWQTEVVRYWGLVPFISITMFLVAMIQFLAIGLPFAVWFSKGLRADANRSRSFYIVSGALIGGGPWILLMLILSTFAKGEPEQVTFFLYPSVSTGVFAGTILKRRLIKLLEATSIENRIK